MLTVTRRTRVYKSRELDEVDTLVYCINVPMPQQISQFLKDGFVDMGGSLFTKVYDLSKTDRHVVSVKLESGDQINGRGAIAKSQSFRGVRTRAEI